MAISSIVKVLLLINTERYIIAYAKFIDNVGNANFKYFVLGLCYSDYKINFLSYLIINDIIGLYSVFLDELYSNNKFYNEFYYDRYNYLAHYFNKS
jgi:hypothetical protein